MELEFEGFQYESFHREFTFLGGEHLISWPSSADSDKSNPMTVELNLRRVIQEAQVSLLGELDLDSPSSWANTNWSLSQLAEYVFSFPALKASLTEGINTKARRDRSFDKPIAVIYPASIAIWSVSQAQHLDTGQELWTTADLNPNQIAALSYKFEDSIRTLELETFDGKLSDQKRLSLARFHAIIPNYAIDEFVRVLKRCEEQHHSVTTTLAVLNNTQTLSISVKGLFEARPDIATDVIGRAFRTLRTGESAGLPPRISRVLLSQVGKRRSSISNYRDSNPILCFDESVGELYVKGHSGWKLYDENSVEILPAAIPQKNLYAQHLDGSRAQILNLDDGYLVLSKNLEVVPNGNQLPRDGALMWSNGISFDTSSIATEPIAVSGWTNWNFALLRPIDKLNLKLQDGRIRSLGKSRDIEIVGEPIPNVHTVDGFAVYSKSPRLAVGQNLTISSNINQTSKKSTGEEEFLVEDNGYFDLTIYAGLGRSVNLRGFLLQDLKLTDIDFPLFDGETRIINLTYSAKFSGPNTATIRSNSDPSRIVLTETSTSRSIPLTVSIPTLEWSLLMENREPQRFRKLAKLPLKEMEFVRRLVIQESSRTDVCLRLDVNGELLLRLMSKIRGNSLIFDLKMLKDAVGDDEVDLSIEMKSRSYKILSFATITTQRNIKGIRITDLRNLAEGMISTGKMTQEEWDNYQEEMKRYSREVMAAYRLRRERR